MLNIWRRLHASLCLFLLGIGCIPAAALAVPPGPPPEATLQVLPLENGIAATTYCGVYEQTNGAPGWTKIPGLDQNVINVARAGGDTLFAIGMAGEGENTQPALFRRERGGAWTLVADAPARANNVATSTGGSRVYITTGYTGGRIWRSDDLGRSWKQVYQAGNEEVLLDVIAAGSPSGRSDMVVAVGRADQDSPRKVIRSLDSGATWQTVPSERIPTNDAQLFVDHAATTVYVVNNGANGLRLGRVRDRGQVEAVGLPEGWSGAPYPISSLAAFEGTLVLSFNHATNQSTVISTRQGAAGSYTNFDQGLRGGISGLAYIGGSPTPTLVAATHNGIFQRTSGTTAWTPLATQPRGCAATDPTPSPAPNPPAIDPFAPVIQQPNTNQRRFFPETQHTLSFEFKLFWERHGGLPIFGYPLSEEFSERNVDLDRDFTTQYLERERFEFHPENKDPYRVLLGRLGDELLKKQGRDWHAEDDLTNPFERASCRRFDVGGEQRQVCGPFLQYWQTHGLQLDGRAQTSYEESLALFGLPLTGVRMETNLAGDSVLTQWFERARFEWHPNNPEPYKVLLGLLGKERAGR